MTLARAVTVRTYFEALTAGTSTRRSSTRRTISSSTAATPAGPFSDRTVGLEAARAGFHAFREAWAEGTTRGGGRSRPAARSGAITSSSRPSSTAAVARAGSRSRPAAAGRHGSRATSSRRRSCTRAYEQALLAARREELQRARLYFVCEAQPDGTRPGELLEAAIRGGADVIQLREKAPRCAEELIAFAEPFAPRGPRARRAVLPQRRARSWSRPAAPTASTSARTTPPSPRRGRRRGRGASSASRPTRPAQFDAAIAASGDAAPDQISAGPVWETPTKAGRPAAGLALIEHAARVAGDRCPGSRSAGSTLERRRGGRGGRHAGRVVRAIRDAATRGGGAGAAFRCSSVSVRRPRADRLGGTATSAISYAHLGDSASGSSSAAAPDRAIGSRRSRCRSPESAPASSPSGSGDSLIAPVGDARVVEPDRRGSDVASRCGCRAATSPPSSPRPPARRPARSRATRDLATGRLGAPLPRQAGGVREPRRTLVLARQLNLYGSRRWRTGTESGPSGASARSGRPSAPSAAPRRRRGRTNGSRDEARRADRGEERGGAGRARAARRGRAAARS